MTQRQTFYVDFETSFGSVQYGNLMSIQTYLRGLGLVIYIKY